MSRITKDFLVSLSRFDYTTPSASFIGTANHIQDTATTEEPTELGWKMYSLEEKNMKMKLHVDFLKTCLEEDIIPKGLNVDLMSTTGQDDEIFQNKWKETLRHCSKKLAECLVEHYERQLAQNVTLIADTLESLEKIEDFTERDKLQLKEEIKTIIDPKEARLKELKQKKLEVARKNKQATQQVQTPNRGTETYAEILKRHIHQKLNPSRSESTERNRPPGGRNLWRNREPPRQDRSWGYQRYPPRSENYPQQTRDRSWGYQRYPPRSENYPQQTRGRSQPQWRNFLDGRRPARTRYKY